MSKIHRQCKEELSDLRERVKKAEEIAALPLEFDRAKTTYCAGFNDARNEFHAALKLDRENGA